MKAAATLGGVTRPRGLRCPKCQRFARWHRWRYWWVSVCCTADMPDRRRRQLVVEPLSEWTLPDGQRAIIALAREDLNPNTITRSPSP